MKKVFLALLLVLAAASPVLAQQGNMVARIFPGAPTGTCGALQFAVNAANGDFYDCASAAWVKVSGGGGGGTPAGATGSLQFNGGAGAFGTVTPGTIVTGNANCDGDGNACQLFTTNPVGVFEYFIGGKNLSAPVGNFFNCSNENDGGVFCIATNGTSFGNMSFGPGSDTSISSTDAAGINSTGVNDNPDNKMISVGRLTFDSNYVPTVGNAAFCVLSGCGASGGWGTTAAVTGGAGSDNNFEFIVTTGGAGIAANPTAIFTFAGGDFDTGSSSTVPYVCSQEGGNDIFADITRAVGQTSVTLTWHGTPTTAKTYQIDCNGIPRN